MAAVQESVGFSVTPVALFPGKSPVGGSGTPAAAWTRVADGQWYLHLFDDSQPDLDWRNPEVGDMFESVLRFWLDRGVDGFRVDVGHSMAKEPGLPDMDLSILERVDGMVPMRSNLDPRRASCRPAAPT